MLTDHHSIIQQETETNSHFTTMALNLKKRSKMPNRCESRIIQ